MNTKALRQMHDYINRLTTLAEQRGLAVVGFNATILRLETTDGKHTLIIEGHNPAAILEQFTVLPEYGAEPAEAEAETEAEVAVEVLDGEPTPTTKRYRKGGK